MDFSLSTTTVIDAPPAAVFDVVTDVDRLPEWNDEVTKVVERPATLAVGAEWVVEMHALHTIWRSRSTVVEVDAERGCFAYRSRSDDGKPSYADWRWEVTADAGGARVQVSVEAPPRSFWRRHLLSRIRPTGLRRAMERSLRALRGQVTAGRDDATPKD